MKILLPSSRNSAHVLFIVLIAAGVLTAAVGSYLALASNQNRTVTRSLGWNAALPLAEAGIEEALSHLNKNLAMYNADGWVQKGTTYTKARRTVGDGYYDVSLSGSPWSLVTINSKGSALWGESDYVSRSVQVIAQPQALPPQIGLVARNINFGGTFNADSYDSHDPAHSSTNANAVGMYDRAKSTDLVTVATPDTMLNMGGSTRIFGYIAVGPGGVPSVKGAAMVGDKSWNSKGIQPGHSTNNFITPMPEVLPPYRSADAPQPGTVNGNNYDYVLTGGKYMVSSINNLSTIYVTGDSMLYVTGEVNVSKVIFGRGARMDLFLSAPNVTFFPTISAEDENGVQTQAVKPEQMMVWGLPSVSTMDMTSAKSFVGAIYAPQTALKASANGALFGAITADSFDCTGTYDFHYDTGLSKLPRPIGVKIFSWTEQ